MCVGVFVCVGVRLRLCGPLTPMPVWICNDLLFPVLKWLKYFN